MSYTTQDVKDELKIAQYRVRIDDLIDKMNKDNIIEIQREIAALKYKIKALLGTQGDQAMDWGIRTLPGVKI